MTRFLRFSQQWWLSLATASLFFAAGALFVAHVLAGREGASLFLWVMAAVLIGDLLLALLFEAIAPTRVVVGPGDRSARDDLLHEPAVTVDGFEASELGRVRIRGEVWLARHVTSEQIRPRKGERVRVVAREGLILLVSRDAAFHAVTAETAFATLADAAKRS